MKVEFFDAETNNKRATYTLDESKWPELEDLMDFIKKLISFERADFAVFSFAGSVYTIHRNEEKAIQWGGWFEGSMCK